MSENFKLSFLVQVAAGLIVAALIALGSFVLGWWPAIWDWIVSAFTTTLSILTFTIPVPLWVFIPLALVVVFAGLIIFANFRPRRAKDSSKPSFVHYIQDTIHDVVWRWDWQMRGGKYEIKNLLAYCPTCDGQLIFHDRTGYTRDSCVLICEHCGHSAKTTFEEGDHFYAQGFVSREILRRLRTGESHA